MDIEVQDALLSTCSSFVLGMKQDLDGDTTEEGIPIFEALHDALRLACRELELGILARKDRLKRAVGGSVGVVG